GPEDGATDVMYQDAIARALELGVNMVDTAINYRHQRSERSIRTALATAISRGTVRRDEIVVATKGGYIPFDGAVPRDARAWFTETYLDTGIVKPGDVAAGSHCMTPRYLADQIGRSRTNLGLDTIDIYYLHNPESQLEAGDRHEFLTRVRAAFEALEAAVRRLGVYVMASASVYQGHLTKNLPPVVAEFLPGFASDGQRALQFVRSTPGIGTALVGMKSTAHVEENAAIAQRPPTPWSEFQ